MTPGAPKNLSELQTKSVTLESLAPPHKKRKSKTQVDNSVSQDPSKVERHSKLNAIKSSVIYPLTPSPDMTGKNIRERIPSISLPPGIISEKLTQTPPSSPAISATDDTMPTKYINTSELPRPTLPSTFNPQVPIHPHVIIAGTSPAMYYHPNQTAYYQSGPSDPNIQKNITSSDTKKASNDADSSEASTGTDQLSHKAAATPSSLMPGMPSNMPAFAYLAGQPYSYPTYMVPGGSMPGYSMVPHMSPPLHPSITSSPTGGRRGTTADQREQLRKVSHSAIERRRREKINVKIQQLRQLIPSCADQDHLHKLNILQSAIEYIGYLHEVLRNMETDDGSSVLELAARNDLRMLGVLQHLQRLSPTQAVLSSPSTSRLLSDQNRSQLPCEEETQMISKRKAEYMEHDESAKAGLMMLSQAISRGAQEDENPKHRNMHLDSLLCEE
ncbi:hypothetical protein INT43_004789 [Umbelopsis isabellina]|uniref:BHLH domain-containing protein n=1 Tax=Mortierella isabellina TaxID=91625 RepID=A0A8H7PE51_MORIS|nr:hypothetical protein INT43_004789 [Umbelopsis isabellina]